MKPRQIKARQGNVKSFEGKENYRWYKRWIKGVREVINGEEYRPY